MALNSVHVNASKPYDVIIGEKALLSSGDLLKRYIPTARAIIVSDDRVAPLHLSSLEKVLSCVNIQAESFIFPHGEQSKNAAIYLELLNAFASKKLHRGDTIIALGGGVVGDLAGFAAATYLRGIPYIQVPTTLLSAVDSSVGGKTAINLPSGKNLVGAFYQPSLVLCDTNMLKTLDEENIKCGMAEVIKYALLGDAAFYDALMKKSLNFDAIITRCVEMKSEIVAHDEFDRGTRKLLNFGHTLAHAIEACSQYKIPHGLAVSLGMAMMAQIAERNGCCSEETKNGIFAILKAYDLPVTSPFTLSQLAEKLTSDKKVEGTSIDLVIPASIGHCILRSTPLNELNAFILKGMTK